jgi:hypothetical protein
MKNPSKLVVGSLIVVSIVGIQSSTITAQSKSKSPEVLTASPSSAPPLRRAKPGSAEERRLAKSFELAKRGLIPVYSLGEPPAHVAVPRPVVPRNVGTRIVPDRNVKGPALELQEEISVALSQTGLVPTNRQAHFSWMESNEHFRQGKARQIGWHGSILAVEPASPGHWTVTVRVFPHIHAPGYRSPVLDFVTETYQYTRGGIRFVNSDAAVPKPRLQAFPVMH